MVGAAHEGTARHPIKAHTEGGLAPGVELPGRNVTGHGQGPLPRLKVLSGEHPAAGMKKIPQSLHHFGGSLAEAEHHSRFDRDLRVGDPDPAKKIEGAGIDGLRPDLRIEARHGFQIVVEDVRTGRKDSLQAGCTPRKSGMRTSMRAAGSRVRRARTVSANAPAPPSARSSRVTDVTTKTKFA